MIIVHHIKYGFVGVCCCSCILMSYRKNTGWYVRS